MSTVYSIWKIIKHFYLPLSSWKVRRINRFSKHYCTRIWNKWVRADFIKYSVIIYFSVNSSPSSDILFTQLNGLRSGLLSINHAHFCRVYFGFLSSALMGESLMAQRPQRGLSFRLRSSTTTINMQRPTPTGMVTCSIKEYRSWRRKRWRSSVFPY